MGVEVDAIRLDNGVIVRPVKKRKPSSPKPAFFKIQNHALQLLIWLRESLAKEGVNPTAIELPILVEVIQKAGKICEKSAYSFAYALRELE